MSLITTILFGDSILDGYLLTSIIITAIFVLYMLFLSRIFEGIPYIQKLDTLLFITVLLSWLAFAFKNFITIITSNIWYSLTVVVIILIITTLIIELKKIK